MFHHDIEELKQLMAKPDFDPNRSFNGKTLPIHVAAEAQDEVLINDLIVKGADVNKGLLRALKLNKLQTAVLILDHSLKKGLSVDTDAKAEFFKYIVDVSDKTVSDKELLTKLNQVKSEKFDFDSIAYPLLKSSIGDKNIELTKLLLTFCKNVNNITKGKNLAVPYNYPKEKIKAKPTILDYAVSKLDLPSVIALCDAGADIKTAKCDFTIHDVVVSPLYYVLYRNDIAFAQFLVDRGIDINSENLLFSEMASNPTVVKFLIDNGADVNLTDDLGRTVLHLALEEDNLEMINTIVDCCVDNEMDIPNDTLNDLMIRAAAVSNEALTPILRLIRDDDFELDDEMAYDILETCLMNEQRLEMVKQILPYIKNISEVMNDDGDSIFLKVLHLRDKELTKLFISAGIDVHEAYKKALDDLNMHFIVDLAKVGADIHIRHKSGRTLYQLAQESKDPVFKKEVGWLIRSADKQDGLVNEAMDLTNYLDDKRPIHFPGLDQATINRLKIMAGNNLYSRPLPDVSVDTKIKWITALLTRDIESLNATGFAKAIDNENNDNALKIILKGTVDDPYQWASNLTHGYIAMMLRDTDVDMFKTITDSVFHQLSEKRIVLSEAAQKDLASFIRGTPIPDIIKKLRTDRSVKDYLWSLSETDKIKLITALLTNNADVISNYFSQIKVLNDRDLLNLKDIFYNSANGFKPEANQFVLQLITNILKNPVSPEPLINMASERILTYAFASINNADMRMRKKHEIISALYIDLLKPPELFLTYQEGVKPAFSNRSNGIISNQEFIVATKAATIDYSDAILLSLGLLQSCIASEDGKHKDLAGIIKDIHSKYLNLKYEECLDKLARICVDKHFGGVIGQEKCELILNLISDFNKLKEVEIFRNYSRRYLENNAAGMMLANEINVDSLNTISKALFGPDHVEITEANAVLPIIVDNFDLHEDDDVALLASQLRKLSQHAQSKGRGHREDQNIYTPDNEMLLDFHEFTEMIGSRNPAAAKAEQPMPRDEISDETMYNRNPEAATYSQDEKDYPLLHRRSPFVASISGHAFHFVAHLIKYMDKTPGFNPDDVTNTIKAFVIYYMAYGYHSYLECVHVLQEPAVVKLLAERGVVLDSQLIPPEILANAFKDTQNYTKTCLINVTAQSEMTQIREDYVEAVFNQNEDKVNTLLQKYKWLKYINVDENYTNSKGETQLFNAVRKGSIDEIRKHIDAGANLNHLNNKQESVLSLAMLLNRLDIFELVLPRDMMVIQDQSFSTNLLKHDNLDFLRSTIARISSDDRPFYLDQLFEELIREPNKNTMAICDILFKANSPDNGKTFLLDDAVFSKLLALAISKDNQVMALELLNRCSFTILSPLRGRYPILSIAMKRDPLVLDRLLEAINKFPEALKPAFLDIQTLDYSTGKSLTPLLSAIEAKDPILIEKLLKAGANPLISVHGELEQRYPLIEIARSGDDRLTALAISQIKNQQVAFKTLLNVGALDVATQILENKDFDIGLTPDKNFTFVMNIYAFEKNLNEKLPFVTAFFKHFSVDDSVIYRKYLLEAVKLDSVTLLNALITAGFDQIIKHGFEHKPFLEIAKDNNVSPAFIDKIKHVLQEPADAKASRSSATLFGSTKPAEDAGEKKELKK